MLILLIAPTAGIYPWGVAGSFGQVAMESSAVTSLRSVVDRVQQAAERSGRLPERVKVVAVSKTKPVSVIRQVYDAGHRCFGENYVQEIIEKAPQVSLSSHLLISSSFFFSEFGRAAGASYFHFFFFGISSNTKGVCFVSREKLVFIFIFIFYFLFFSMRHFVEQQRGFFFFKRKVGFHFHFFFFSF